MGVSGEECLKVAGHAVLTIHVQHVCSGMRCVCCWGVATGGEMWGCGVVVHD